VNGLVLLDTSCIVALVADWHERHEETVRAANKLPHLVIASHTLLESYAVLTRLPAPFRMAPSAAATLVSQIAKDVRAVGLTPREMTTMLQRAKEQNVTGGRTYDFAIGVCAEKAKAVRLLTWNVRHFQNLDLMCQVCSPAEV
jgi:uncharacterized protein with PIN domain